jgi:hypothetical protein
MSLELQGEDVDSETIKERFNQALSEFVETELDLLTFDAHERSISFKFAEYLGRKFQGWDIDCEYNRIGTNQEQKLIICSKDKFTQARRAGKIPGHITTYEELQTSTHAVAVYPDIIIHNRGNPDSNLLIVEIKKANNPEVILGWDEFKIKFFLGSMNYQAGVFVVFNTVTDKCLGSDIIRDPIWFI